MAMEAGAMPGGSTPPSPLRPPAHPLLAPSPAASPLHQSTPPRRRGITSMPSTAMEQGGQASGDLEQDGVGCIDVEKQTSGVVRVELQAGSEVLRSGPSSKKQRKKGCIPTSGEVRVEKPLSANVNEEQPASGDIREEQLASGVCRHPRNVTTAHSKEISPTAGSKRPFSEASGSLRASKAAKIINAKVVRTQLQNKSKTARKNMPLIVSRSPIIIMMARQKAQSYARSPRSHARSPDSTKSPLHDVSPAATNGSKRRPRKLTSSIWNDAEPIYIDGFLMQGRCKYCSSVFPAS